MDYRVLNIIDSILGPHKSYANSEFYYHCPFCHHYNPKLAVNLAKRKWQCWKCGAKGGKIISLLRRLDVSYEQIRQLKDLLGDEVPHAHIDDAESVQLTLPNEFIPLADVSKLFEWKNAIRYLMARGITPHDVLRYNIGYCSEGMYKNRIIVPSYDSEGQLNYFVGRDYYEVSSLKYMNPRVSKNIIGFENHINWNYPIVLCEGVFDAMAIKRNAIPQLGKYVPKKLQKRILQHDVEDIYLALDDDALKQTVKIAEQFMKEGKNVYLVDMAGHDPSQVGFEEMQRRIKAATKLSFVDLIHLKLKLK